MKFDKKTTQLAVMTRPCNLFKLIQGNNITYLFIGLLSIPLVRTTNAHTFFVT